MFYTFPGWLVSSVSITTLVTYYYLPKTSVVSSFEAHILFPFIFFLMQRNIDSTFVDVLVLIFRQIT